MGRIISVHSSRGGTGKSLISVNLAVICAKRGRDVSLLDLDFRAPSLSTVFKERDYWFVEHWTNDFLSGRCPIEKVMIDLTERYDTKGRFLVGLANPSLDAIREMITMDREREMEALRRLFDLKRVLLDELKMDYAIYDTSPGIQYSSVNAVASSDVPLVVTTLDTLDAEGVRYMLSELYDAFGKKSVILVNKAFPEAHPRPGEKQEELLQQMEATFHRPVLGIIPCYCDILQADRTTIFALENPNHPFTRALQDIAERLELVSPPP